MSKITKVMNDGSNGPGWERANIYKRIVSSKSTHILDKSSLAFITLPLTHGIETPHTSR